MKKYIYVDYENMNNLKEIPNIPNVKYFFFVGAKQNSIPKSLVLAQNNNEVEWIDINGTGKNALDFYIVYYLAKNDTEKDVFHYILSKDTGFDPLIKTINKNHNLELVKRIEDLSKLSSSVVITKENNAEIESEQKSKKIPNENYEKVLTSLKKNKKEFSENRKNIEIIYSTFLQNKGII